MKTIQEMRERRAELAKKTRALLDNSDTWSEENDKSYNEYVAEIDEIDAKVDREQKVLDIEAANRQAIGAEAEKRGVSEDEAKNILEKEHDIFDTWLRGGENHLNAEQRAYIDEKRLNTMSTTTDSEGGYTVPTDTASRLLEELQQFGNMRQFATVQRTSMGNPIEWPTTDNTSQEGEIVGENIEVSDQDTTFGVKTIGAYKYSSKGVAVPFELLQDSAINLESHILGLLGQRLGRITNRHFTIGTGTGQPEGLVTASAAGPTAAAAAAIAYDDLVELEHSVDPAYRLSPSWMFADSTLKLLKKLKDGDGRPLWAPGIASSEPNTLLGYGYGINQFMDPVATTNKSVLFGDFSTYMIRDVMAFSLFRMTDSAYTRKGQVGFLAFMRSDGKLMDVSGASVKHLLHP